MFVFVVCVYLTAPGLVYDIVNVTCSSQNLYFNVHVRFVSPDPSATWISVLEDRHIYSSDFQDLKVTNNFLSSIIAGKVKHLSVQGWNGFVVS